MPTEPLSLETLVSRLRWRSDPLLNRSLIISDDVSRGAANLIENLASELRASERGIVKLQEYCDGRQKMVHQLVEELDRELHRRRAAEKRCAKLEKAFAVTIAGPALSPERHATVAEPVEGNLMRGGPRLPS